MLATFNVNHLNINTFPVFLRSNPTEGAALFLKFCHKIYYFQLAIIVQLPIYNITFTTLLCFS